MVKVILGKIDLIKYFLILLLLTGYPKDPFWGIPLSLIVMALFFREIVSTLSNKFFFPQIFTLFLFFLYFCTRWFLQHDSTLQDFNFIVTLVYKALTGVLIAKAFFELLEKKFRLIYLYLAIQLTLILVSAYNVNLYSFLLQFQTGAAQDVFVHTFGLRSMGFGVIHNEGVVFLALFYSFLIYKNQSSKLGFLFSPLIYISGLTSRTGMFLIVALQFFISPLKLALSFFIILIAVIFLFDTSSGPLSEVFELYNNYVNYGELSSKSTDAISTMRYIPDNFSSWMIGDGKFFADDKFYMETDIGFSRILFFGGIVGLFFYLVFNLWPLFFLMRNKNDRNFYYLLLGLIICFTLTNIKGINIQNWAFIVLLLISKQNAMVKSNKLD